MRSRIGCLGAVYLLEPFCGPVDLGSVLLLVGVQHCPLERARQHRLSRCQEHVVRELVLVRLKLNQWREDVWIGRGRLSHGQEAVIRQQPSVQWREDQLVLDVVMQRIEMLGRAPVSLDDRIFDFAVNLGANFGDDRLEQGISRVLKFRHVFRRILSLPLLSSVVMRCSVGLVV